MERAQGLDLLVGEAHQQPAAVGVAVGIRFAAWWFFASYQSTERARKKIFAPSFEITVWQ